MSVTIKPVTMRQTGLIRHRLQHAGLPVRKIQTQTSEATVVTTIAAPRNANAARYEDVLLDMPRLDKRVDGTRRVTVEYTRHFLLLTVSSRIAGATVPALKVIHGDAQPRIPLDLVQPGDFIQLPGVWVGQHGESRIRGWSPIGLVQNLSVVRGRWRVSWMHGEPELVDHAALPYGARLISRTRYSVG
ncbi:Hypothetical protein AJAP_42845 (plasmid) [Amycolatopsis japonica]|uniref:Uncharacterized protein n=1 Tax=Amycolatopsis japonica TaxID=208439 RepID=A0A075VAH2_9PSEU|nr:hypothetical protein [Amycolatopsis japonica]AIG81336.1 Hypothetical protein AJAP_42845 [Amycolatopsis japonica]